MSPFNLTTPIFPYLATSYGGESEGSDWAPPTEGGGGGEEEEEVGDLVTEAKDFISNQKMWQP